MKAPCSCIRIAISKPAEKHPHHHPPTIHHPPSPALPNYHRQIGQLVAWSSKARHSSSQACGMYMMYSPSAHVLYVLICAYYRTLVLLHRQKNCIQVSSVAIDLAQ